MRLILTIFTTIIALSAIPSLLLAALPDFTSKGDCQTALDSSRTLYNDGDKKSAHNLLVHMQSYCIGLPQIQHNLGVIAVSHQQYDQAIDHFQRSLKQDTRSQHTFDQLQAVLAYQASIAYGEALQLSSRADKPQLEMQDSTYTNSSPPRLLRTHSDLHNISTVEYELYDWWQSARENNKEAWLSHYEHQYPPATDSMQAPVEWQDTQRRINFTAQDAVAIVTYQSNGLPQHRQLLMRLQENRWKIYQEQHLQ